MARPIRSRGTARPNCVAGVRRSTFDIPACARRRERPAFLLATPRANQVLRDARAVDSGRCDGLAETARHVGNPGSARRIFSRRASLSASPARGRGVAVNRDAGDARRAARRPHENRPSERTGRRFAGSNRIPRPARRIQHVDRARSKRGVRAASNSRHLRRSGRPGRLRRARRGVQRAAAARANDARPRRRPGGARVGGNFTPRAGE